MTTLQLSTQREVVTLARIVRAFSTLRGEGPASNQKWNFVGSNMKLPNAVRALIIFIPGFFTTAACADPAGDLLDQIAALDKAGFEQQQGYLFRGLFQLDPENLTYVVYIEDRKYDVILDDGRGTSERAKNCIEENFFDENPSTGCAIKFDGEYLVEDNGGSVAVKAKIWNVSFE